MRTYEQDLPLIFMHIPKTGGNAVKHVLIRWYGKDQYIRPYREGLIELKDDPRLGNSPVVLGGHWPVSKGVLEAVAPQIEDRQIITVVRDVFSMCKSMYSYGLQRDGDTAARRAGSWDAYLDSLHKKRGGISMFSYLPRVQGKYCLTTYSRQFMMVGITENLELSIAHLGVLIGREAPETIPIRNPTKEKPNDVNDDRRTAHKLDSHNECTLPLPAAMLQSNSQADD